MLSTDDAALVARDPLPGLGLALDADAAAQAFADAFPALGVRGATPTYVRYKEATNCLAGYRLSCADGLRDAYLRTHARPGDPKLRKILGAAGHCAVAVDAHTVAVVCPYDSELPVLARLADQAGGSRLLVRILGVTEDWRLHRVRYNPERRWVGRLEASGHAPLAVKVQREDAHRRAVAGARAFAAAGLPAASLVAKSDRHGVTVYQWLSGPTVAQHLASSAGLPLAGGGAGGSATAAVRSVGEVLAAVHANPDAGRPLARGPAEEAGLAAAARTVTTLCPSLSTRTDALTALDLRAAATRERLLHGDFSLDQVVLGPGGPAFVDFDRAARGDPHIDLAQVLADLAVRRLAGPCDDGGAVADAVLAGYEAAGGHTEPRALAALTAGRLLRLASEPFRRRQPGWAAATEAIVEEALRCRHGGVLA